ncbi:MAG: hypothetical protein LUH59_04335 [Firmicutes bacterium]|nr:hypothetical protein [Bacillota bacterium]
MKRVFIICLCAAMIFCTFGCADSADNKSDIAAGAAEIVEVSTKEESDDEIDYSGRSDLAYEADVLDAYESLCKYVEESEISWSISLDDFSYLYESQEDDFDSVYDFLDECIEDLSQLDKDYFAEVREDSATLHESAEIVEDSIVSSADYDALTDGYNALIEYIEDEGIDYEISFENFCALYQSQKDSFGSVDDFTAECIEDVSQLAGQTDSGDVSVSSVATSDESWFYNTATTLYVIPDYSTYNLLGVVAAGDIIYEAKGGGSITGHCTIVEGIYYSAKYNQYYIRIVESIPDDGEGDGVCRGILDDSRYDAREGTILRVTSATTSEKKAAVSFCTGQIGKDYELPLLGGVSTSSSSSDWYCSELVWAAYKAQGISLVDSVGMWVTPKNILDSSLTSARTAKSSATPSPSITILSSTSVKISWSSIDGATYYSVYRTSSSANGTYTLLKTTSSTTYTDTTCVEGEHYYYKVKVTSTGNESSPQAVWMDFYGPTIQSYYAPSSSSAYIRWGKVYGATHYYVYRSTDNSTFTKVYSTAISSSYRDTGLSANTTYYYKIAAYSSETGEMSSFGITVSIKTSVVETPVIYYSRTDSSYSVTIKWSNVPDATKYYIYRATSSTGTYAYVGSQTSTSYTDSIGLSSGTTYYYKVKAYYSGSYSSLSSYKSAKTSS